ncbi:MAG TPA: hypothetical protein VHT92_10125 [Candidatus Cybelea sp.]|nr:hypothetical protein [Candidatus Cybelea sp.]
MLRNSRFPAFISFMNRALLITIERPETWQQTSFAETVAPSRSGIADTPSRPTEPIQTEPSLVRLATEKTASIGK